MKYYQDKIDNVHIMDKKQRYIPHSSKTLYNPLHNKLSKTERVTLHNDLSYDLQALYRELYVPLEMKLYETVCWYCI